MAAHFVIPAGTGPRRCLGCGGLIYWIVYAKTGNKLPLEILPEDPESFTPDREHDGQGTSHFATCPARDRFRKAKPAHPPREHKPRKDLD